MQNGVDAAQLTADGDLPPTLPPRFNFLPQALDALTREKMNVELHRIWRETGTTVMLVTHPVAEAVYLANRVVVMSPRPGRIVDILDVDLPAHREYSATVERPEFISVANTVRDLLGATTSAD